MACDRAGHFSFGGQMQIRDSVFIVTGGASGLGAGTVRALAGQGG